MRKKANPVLEPLENQLGAIHFYAERKVTRAAKLAARKNRRLARARAIRERAEQQSRQEATADANAAVCRRDDGLGGSASGKQPS
jgi:hypothetical protein